MIGLTNRTCLLSIAAVMMKSVIEGVVESTEGIRDEEVMTLNKRTLALKTELPPSVVDLGLDQMKIELEVKDAVKEVVMKAAHKVKVHVVAQEKEVIDLSHLGTQMIEEVTIGTTQDQITEAVEQADTVARIVTKSLCQA